MTAAKKVLLIDDNEDNLALFSFLLSDAGYDVVSSRTGIGGLEQAAAELPHFILLDVQLPDIDGLEVLRRLRASEHFQSIPVVAVTSFAMPGDRDRLLSAGCNGYMEKPIKAREFVKKLESIIAVE